MKTWTARNKVNTADSRGGRESQKRLDGSTAEMGGRGPAVAEELNFGLKRKTNKQTNKKHATSWFPETYLEQKHRKESERVDSRFGKITMTWRFGLGSQRSEVVQRHRLPGASTRLPGAGRLAGPGRQPGPRAWHQSLHLLSPGNP